MNKMIETVLNDKEAKAVDYFNLINYFDCASLSLQSGNIDLSMGINAFQEIHEGFEFSQKCSDTRYAIQKSDIKSVEGKIHEETDSFQIIVSMLDGSKINIFIYHTDTNIKTIEREHYREIGVENLKEYLDSKYHESIMATVRDTFGFTVKLSVTKYAYVSDDDEGGYSLHISDGILTTIELPLVDDSCNEVYIKDGDTFDNILIKPYGQPFLEISLLVNKAVENKPEFTVIK